MTGHESAALVRAVSELTARPVSWLWPGRLALGKPALLEGDPGLGKSLIALDLCARLSRGDPLPDGSVGPGPSSSIVLNGEDTEEDTVLPRLQALGADLDRVFVPSAEELEGAGLRFPTRLGWLDAALEQTRARLVVVDPLPAFLDGSVCIGNDQSVRRALTPLARLAERHACCVLLLRHLNKGGGKQAIYRGAGSIGLVGACRSAWLAGRDPLDAGRCVLAQVKNNLAPRQPSLAYRVLLREGAPPRLSWEGSCSWDADRLVGGLSRGWARARAREFLLAQLRDGPKAARELWGEAQKQGLAEATLKRAKRDLGIRVARVPWGESHRSVWLLPGQEVPAGAAPPVDADSLEAWLAPLREKYASRTPLEEEE